MFSVSQSMVGLTLSNSEAPLDRTGASSQGSKAGSEERLQEAMSKMERRMSSCIDKVIAALVRDVGEPVQGVQIELAWLRRDIADMQGALTMQQAQIGRLHDDLQLMRDHLRLEAERIQVRFFNYMAQARSLSRAPLPVKTASGEVPQDFPKNFWDVVWMSDKTVVSILEEYGLETSGTPKERRQRLGSHIGLYAY